MMLPLRQTPVRFTATALLFAVLIGAPAAALAALDLTGTWAGTWKCKDVTGGAATKPQGTISGTVTQSGSNVNAFFIFNGVGGGVASYQGHVEELTAKPGQGATTLIACGTTAGSSSYAEALSANVKVSSSSATFKAVSVYEEADISRVGGTCKYSLKRTATADPGVGACPAVCGNGVLDPGEECDDGNASDTDACVSSDPDPAHCRAPRCGDGHVWVGVEQCDDGAANAYTDDCLPSCQLNVCGDGFLDTTGSHQEVCDDGNQQDETECPYGTATCTGCSADCTQVRHLTGPYCGDGHTDTLDGEQCDDGNTVSGDGCSATCQAE
jgi:cysteine-rich repeat protein